VWRKGNFGDGGAAMGKGRARDVERVQPIGLRISSLVGSVAAGRRTHEPIPFAAQCRQGSLSNERRNAGNERRVKCHWIMDYLTTSSG